jgi:hypothetical protein
MPRITIFGTSHRLQGITAHDGFNVDDPSYKDLLETLFKGEDGQDKPDFLFEEVAGRGISSACLLALSYLGEGRYKDIDPSEEERPTLGIGKQTSNNFAVNPMGAEQEHDTAGWQHIDEHRKRENLWIKRIEEQKFTHAIFICGAQHLLSMAYALKDRGHDVTALTYFPEHKLCCRRHVVRLSSDCDLYQ